MHFKIGQEVGFLHEKGKGIVRQIEGKRALVADADGFDRWLPFTDLVTIHSEKYDSEEIRIEKSDLEPETNYREFHERTGYKRKETIWEIDLHIEEILESTRGMSNTEILLRQMGEFRATFKKAKQRMIHKLVVIHGVGEGVLKNEIRTYLSKQDQIEVVDADYATYGKGATLVIFHYNWRD